MGVWFFVALLSSVIVIIANNFKSVNYIDTFFNSTICTKIHLCFYAKVLWRYLWEFVFFLNRGKL